MELENTVDLMLSEDYKERFKAEYYQVKIRRAKLVDMLLRWQNGELNFEPKCRFEMLCTQLDIMNAYLSILWDRAKIEGIDIQK